MISAFVVKKKLTQMEKIACDFKLGSFIIRRQMNFNSKAASFATLHTMILRMKVCNICKLQRCTIVFHRENASDNKKYFHAHRKNQKNDKFATLLHLCVRK